jgi:uncharacterized protein DUF262
MMERTISTADISWILDLHKFEKLNLDPPYQRRSVWTRTDKQYFLDTIFKGYPSPPIFIHKDIDNDGVTTYNVVDGKQRLSTILEFTENKVMIAKDFGDIRYDGKKWNQLRNDQEIKEIFWSYKIIIEYLPIINLDFVKQVFDRMNRNSRKLTRQELRHAKFEGWLIETIEEETNDPIWDKIKVITKAREKRMQDVQFISELALVILEQKIHGFDQDLLDEKYGEYEDPSESLTNFSATNFADWIEVLKDFLENIELENKCVSTHAKGLGNFYTLWSILALDWHELPDEENFAVVYSDFMEKVSEITRAKGLYMQDNSEYDNARMYYENARGASTDLSQRTMRLNAMRNELIG